jgi:glycosyltransferase involved in cell wall biosynthesis
MSGPTKLRVLVGIHDGRTSGINTYAEHVAAAAALAGHDVTLLTAEVASATEQRGRLERLGVRIVDLGLERPRGIDALSERLRPAFPIRRLEKALGTARAELAPGYDVVQLNHPALSEALRPYAARVCAQAWFYPHDVRARVRSTWSHTGGRGPRSAVLALKAISHHRNDARGYLRCDRIIAPTTLLADQLAALGISASVCPPPMVPAGAGPAQSEPASDGRTRLVVCAADLSHPRKNVASALRALSAVRRPLVLELIGRNAISLQEEIRRLPPEVEVLAPGPLPQGAVQQRLGSASALLFPSLYEEWGYVAVEALLRGTPVVTFPVYPFQEMLRWPLGGQAVSMADDAYAAAIEKTLERAVDRDGVRAEAGRRFGPETIGRRLTEIWTAS